MNYASFLVRFVAWLIDLLVTGLLAAIAILLVASLLGLGMTLDAGFFRVFAGILGLISIGLLLLLHFLYYGYFWSKSGASLGMKAFDIKVVRRQPGTQVSFWRAGFRGTLGYYISGLVFSLGFLWAAFDQNKEAWHDKLFDTWVIKTEPKPLD